MSRLLLATLGSLGDLHPMLGLALELRRRGHGVALATSEMYRSKVTALGIDFHPLRPDTSFVDTDLVRRVMDGGRGSGRLLHEFIFPAVRDIHADLAHAAAGADVIVASELIYAAPILAAQTGVSWISYSLAPFSLFSACDPSVAPFPGGGLMAALPSFTVRGLQHVARLLTRSWWRPVRELRRELGLPAGGHPLFEGKFSPRLDLALFSAVLAPPQRDWPRQTVQTGFCFFDEAPNALPEHVETFLRAGDPPIVFTLGSAAVYLAENFYNESAAAAQALGRRAILLVGENPPPPALPPNILAWDYLPYAGLFPRAAAVVHQGGIGTTAQALRAGKPMLVMPFAFDQFDNGARVARIGAGRVIARKKFAAASATRELDLLLRDPRFASAAAGAAGALALEHGTRTASDEIERVLS
jgi:rhamnosyltransferase subunit B